MNAINPSARLRAAREALDRAEARTGLAPDVWKVYTARCSDSGGLWLEGRSSAGRDFVVELRHHDAVSTGFDFSECSFGPDAFDRLDELVSRNGVAS